MESLKTAQVQLQEKIGTYTDRTRALAGDLKTRSVATAKDPQVQATVATAATGTVLLGFCGGALGVAAGGIAGGAVGIPFILFTFGLSVPLSAAVGGGIVGTGGAVVGGTAGCAAGGATGYAAYSYRHEIRKFVDSVSAKVRSTRNMAIVIFNAQYNSIQKQVLDLRTLIAGQARDGAAATKAKASALADAGKKVGQDPHAQVTVASAAVGGVACGAGGGIVGLAAGGLAGAAVGVVPALFTFGLSIPFCAMVGSGAGWCVGSAVGGTTGAVGGGAAGYGIYSKRKEIRQGVDGCKTYIKQKIQRGEAASKSVVEDNVEGRLMGSPKKNSARGHSDTAPAPETPMELTRARAGSEANAQEAPQEVGQNDEAASPRRQADPQTYLPMQSNKMQNFQGYVVQQQQQQYRSQTPQSSPVSVHRQTSTTSVSRQVSGASLPGLGAPVAMKTYSSPAGGAFGQAGQPRLGVATPTYTQAAYPGQVYGSTPRKSLTPASTASVPEFSQVTGPAQYIQPSPANTPRTPASTTPRQVYRRIRTESGVSS